MDEWLNDDDYYTFNNSRTQIICMNQSSLFASFKEPLNFIFINWW